MIQTETAHQEQRRLTASPLQWDWTLVLVTGALLIFGLMMVYSTTFDLSYYFNGTSTFFFFKQVRNMVIGFGIMALLASLDYRRLQNSILVVLLMLGTVASLLSVLFLGAPDVETHRNLYEGSYQPSELAKLVTVIYLSVWLTEKKDQLRYFWHGMFPYAVVVGLVTGFILLQPDISAAGTVVVIGGLMFFLAGSNLRQVGFGGAVVCLVGAAVIKASETGQQRIEDYMSGFNDIAESSWHVKQGASALVQGGFFGRGLGASYQKLSFMLPAPHTDSVFAVVGEELGLMGCMVLIGLFIALVWRGASIAVNAPDTMGRLLAGGLTCWIAFEFVVNTAVVVGAFPFAGNALPFISYGGSSLVVMMAAIGILLSVSRHDPEARPDKRIRATIDLRRWNRGTRVSSTGGDR